MATMMKTREEIEAEIQRIEAELPQTKRRYAMAALVARSDALRWVLGE